MHPIDLAAFWPGYAVVASHQDTNNPLTLTLELLTTELPRCGRGLAPSPLIHDQHVQLQAPVRRVDCLNCGRVCEHIDWLEPAFVIEK